ncbi:MAG: hypothetical protein ACLVIU_12395, partial [Paraclostridium sp.]
MRKNMRVLHICSYYIGSKLYKNLVINLEKIGIYNEVYIPINTMDLINKNYEPQLKRTKFTYSKCFNKLDRFNFKLKSKKIYEDLLRKIDFRNVDIVHA